MGCCQNKDSDPVCEHPEVILRSGQKVNTNSNFQCQQSEKSHSEPSTSIVKEKHKKQSLEEYGQELSEVYSRFESHKESDEFHQVRSQFSIKTLEELLFPNKKFDLVFDSFSILSENREWTQIISEPNLKVEQRPASMFKENLVMVRSKIIFEPNIPLFKIVEILHKPELIKNWDTSVDAITLITGKTFEDSVLLTTRIFKGKERKFVDRWSTRATGGMIVSIAVDDKEQPEVEGNGETIFQMTIVEEINAGTRVTLIQQLDPKIQGKEIETQIIENFKNSVHKLRKCITK
ncbi:unnamed protein product [Blepharisma stoltei]|uniref:START domain-containing protein n=1 Tax=Blepharisma stoltei TaxID=1481888 RepID=A0AAU9K440_9CILI|nr:unnamed protein product [Blepharisma stoltei]